MPAVTIIFTDIVNFSENNTKKQVELINGMTEIVKSVLQKYITSTNKELIPLPTGDGMALVFLNESHSTWDFHTIIKTIYTLQKWADDISTEQIPISLRIGIHHGTVKMINDIGGNPNVCGHAINHTQRIMDSANPKQVLVSEDAHREYIGNTLPEYSGPSIGNYDKLSIVGPYEVLTKHYERINVYKMLLEPVRHWWDNDDPITKDIMLVQLTDLPKEIVGSFSDRIKTAEEVAFIQLTGDRFIDKYEKGEIELSSKLKTFHVYMPDPKIYINMDLDSNRANPDFINKCVDLWSIFFKSINKKYNNIDLKFGLIKEPPYLGASFIDWKKPGGTVHISPYVWGISAPNCPGYDLQWIGSNRPSIYEIYVKGLEYIQQNATIIFP